MKDTGTLERKRTATQPITFIGVTFFCSKSAKIFRRGRIISEDVTKSSVKHEHGNTKEH